MPGSYAGGPSILTLVGNIDLDPELEVITTALAEGPVYAWNHDGTPVSGWPVYGSGEGYPVLGRLRPMSTRRGADDVFIGFGGELLGAYGGDGVPLVGWPIEAANFIALPAALANVAGRQHDEIFTDEEDYGLHAYRANATILPGWPIYDNIGGQARFTPACGDLDGDGHLEIVTAAGYRSDGSGILAYHADGRTVSGFPIELVGVATFVAIGDVDGDRKEEIVFVAPDFDGWKVMVVSGNGATKWAQLVTGTLDYGTAPALADLDHDGIPEIIVQTNGTLNVWYGDGTPFPGWPVTWDAKFSSVGNSAPVVGDVDGDGEPEIVVTSHLSSGTTGELRAYKKDGTLHPHFPKTLEIGNGAVPAIADIDLDGRNDIIVCGSMWNGIPGTYDKCWAYDLKGPSYGSIEWGQLGGNASHQGHYPVLRP